MLSLQPANPAVIATWRTYALSTTVVSGAMTLAGLVNVIRNLFPETLLRRFPEYDIYIYAAIAISLMSAIFLTLIRKVITVSFAQLGAITSLVYLFYALAGIFVGELLPVFFVIILLAILIIVLVFGESLAFFKRRRAYADLAIGSLFVVATVFICSYPLYLIVRSAFSQ